MAHRVLIKVENPARHRERLGEAGGIVPLVEHLNFQKIDVKSRHPARLIEKAAHFQIGNELVLSFETNSDGH
jgi:hypothetical protein